MINPIQHGKTEEDVATYKVEPYVMAADVYGVYPHTGRGGWTWYTGSAGWMYQLIIESFLGLKREGDSLSFTPCVPEEWTSFTIHYRYEETDYSIELIQDGNDATVTLDGVLQPSNIITLNNDKVKHEVKIKWHREAQPEELVLTERTK